MTDPLSIASGVAGLLTLAAALMQIGSEYTRSIPNCPNEVQQLVAEVSILTAALEQLSALADRCSVDLPGDGDLDRLRQVMTPLAIEQSKALFREIEKILGKYREAAVESGASGNKIKEAWRTAVWPLKGKEVKGALVKLRELRNNFTTAVTVDSSHTMSEINDRVKYGAKEHQNMKKIIETERLQATMRWLSHLEPQKRHEDVRKVRVKNTGNWLLRAEKFQSWLSVDDGVLHPTAASGNVSGDAAQGNQILCCYGMPGAGKTVLSSLVIDYLSNPGWKVASMAMPEGDTIIGYLYCDYRDQKDQTETNLLGSLLAQFLACQSMPKSIFEEVLDVCEAKQKKLEPLNLEKALEMILLVVQSSRVFICVDAVDELEQGAQLSFLKSLEKIVHGARHTPRLFLTGRPHAQANVHRCLGTGDEASITVTANEGDIRSFIAIRIGESDAEAMDDKLKEEIIETIVAKSGGMFLLPQLHIKTVLEEPTISKRRKALLALPAQLYDAYKVTVSRIQEQPKSTRGLAMALLMWTFLATRLMTVKEIQHALAVKLGDEEFDMDDVASERKILGSCLGLVIIDQETATIRFVHYSLQEFFQKHKEEFFPEGHNSIARICLTYINFGEFAGTYEETALAPLMSKYPLLQYAAVQWASHASKQWDSIVGDLSYRMVLRNIRGTPMSILNYIMMRCTEMGSLSTSLHAVAWFGNKCIMEYILERLTDDGLIHTVVDAVDQNGRTPLVYALVARKMDIVELLLGRSDVNAGTRDKEGWTPLLLAAESGHVGAVRMLLEHSGVDVNAVADAGHTALLYAIFGLRVEIVRMLLNHSGVDVNVVCDGMTPLICAVIIVMTFLNVERRALLNHTSVDANAQVSIGSTTILIAAHSLGVETVGLLLGHSGIDVNMRCNGGYNYPVATLGELASVSKHVKVRDNGGCDALTAAARSGRAESVWLLLDYRGMDVNAVGLNRRTCRTLSSASRMVMESVNIVKLFLDYEGVDLNVRDKNGKTALDIVMETEAGECELEWEGERGECYREIIKLLTDRGAKRGSKLQETSSSEISTPKPSTPETSSTPEKDSPEAPGKEVSVPATSSGRVTGSEAWRWGWLYFRPGWLMFSSSCVLFIFLLFSFYNYFS